MFLPRLMRRQVLYNNRHHGRPLLSALVSRGLKEIRHTEGEKELVVEGVRVKSDRAGRLVDVDRLRPQLMAQESVSGRDCVGVPSKDCHPLCKLPFVNDVKHTDVLILRQFMREDGHVMDRDVTGLCRRQHNRVSKLIKMAAKAGLLPKELDQYRDEKEDWERKQWSNFNTYWDEKTIDAQYKNVQKFQYINSFKK